MTSDYPDLIADIPELYSDLIPDIPQRTLAPQTWNVTVADAKYHWYDLITGFPAAPDIRDPVGRHFRRMQFDLEAAMEKRLIFFVVTRPRVRFDTARHVSWGFFSLKLTVPLLVGAEEKHQNVTLDLEVPFSATLKKPNVTVTDRYITLNWGGFVEALSVHDVLQRYNRELHNDLRAASIVQYVGQTKDPAGRLAKARLSAVQKINQNYSENNDTLLLVQRMHVEVISDDGDPAELEANQNPVAGDALSKDRMDAVEAALIRYFEGSLIRNRNDKEVAARRERLREIESANHLVRFRIDLQLEDACDYDDLVSPSAPLSRGHLVDCVLDDGDVSVTGLERPRQ